jgi:SAM-dependent methyltransferase
VRRGHFAALAPVCPVCRAPLSVASVIRERDDDLLEGILTCTNPQCLREYPVIDGIPIIVAAIRSWLAANPLQVLLRDDLSPELESLLGDALGPGSAFDAIRLHTGMYAADHYERGAARALLSHALDLAGAIDEGPAIDTGCATGGTTFTLAARTARLTLGVDLNFAMLRIASRALREGVVRYPLRRVGVVYDRVEMPVEPSALVDFWCCDATALPFPPSTFALAASLNVLDCVPSPNDAITELARVLREGGKALIATPYDWSPNATPVEHWLGGHSQRGPHRGASEPVLRTLLGPSLEVVAEESAMPWQVRVHERSRMEYDVHVVVARKIS